MNNANKTLVVNENIVDTPDEHDNTVDIDAECQEV